jgi:shikimate 5-dehydrogenase
MLVHQAAHQVALFTGQTPPVEAMFAALGIAPTT